ncbi:MAG: 4-(cytidine 5'-diphospho)-2-C-methyl-D-erythritol kinase [Firmicutes bacterium]|nr:4-(cytidine 5'-diphospho)-2-C-methyl-D-erythritol kinase [Bacillota bacterium]
MVAVEAPAKVNLTLTVTGRRADGYHWIESLMQTVDLVDRVVLVRTPSEAGVRCVGNGVPVGDGNLACRAVRALQEAVPPPAGEWEGVTIRIRKRIPVAGGLAGGSANAAAALIGANALWGLGIGRKELARIGAQVGADVPFCLYGGTAVAQGIGDVLEPVPPAPPLAGVILNPGFPVSTARVYQLYDEWRLPLGEEGRARAMAEAVAAHDVRAVAQLLQNDLEAVTVRLHPEVAALRELVLSAGALGAVMCGSGPSVFGLAENPEHGEHLARRLAGRVPFAVACRFVSHGARITGFAQGPGGEGGTIVCADR